MDATNTVTRLLEEPGDAELDKLSFASHLNDASSLRIDVDDIIKQAEFLKTQCEEAGALHSLLNTTNSFGKVRLSMRDINRALLILAAIEVEETEYGPDLAIKQLKRAMHSIWS